MDPPKDYQCSICLDLLFKPATLLCGHTFCLSCITKVESKHCPHCRRSWDGEPAICIFIWNLLKNLYPEEINKKIHEEEQANTQSRKDSDSLLCNIITTSFLEECKRREDELLIRLELQRTYHQEEMEIQARLEEYELLQREQLQSERQEILAGNISLSFW
eukprot:TRINITY_DN12697_c0_g1_i1.p1 TRINITY_DN12697_c0_g1~~TRINITY_DN12697_c0_g1_i1.p1  ORF type:complete len:161 (+),score=18.93 TRINITY_DN12697_c0_g1_i1:55-537(+)